MSLLGLVLLVPVLCAADSPWQQARIVDVATATSAKNSIFIVNTPIQEQETLWAIRVQFQNKIYEGTYPRDRAHVEPPPQWVKHAPVRVRIAGNTMFLKAPAGKDYRLRIVSAKKTAPMDPWTPEEVAADKAAAAKAQEPPKSVIGFDESAATQPQTTTEPSSKQAPPAEEAPTGTVSISSMPYLAEVFVDGESVGYTPAKLKLPPGKHSFRCEKRGYKPWTKDATVIEGSELTLDATMVIAHK